mgnify:CR=1 FL=1
MRRINPRLDPYELSDLMSDPGNWDLLTQIHDHPGTWPELDQWPRTPSRTRERPERRRNHQPERDPDAGSGPSHPFSTTGRHEPRETRRPRHTRPSRIGGRNRQHDPRKTQGNRWPDSRRRHHTGGMAPGESDEVPVRRRIPLVRIIGITLTLAVIIGSAAGLAAMMSIRDHQAALTSCNQAIKQSDTIRTDWGKVLEQAEPYLRLGDGDVQDPKTLELVAAITRYRLPEPPAACDPDMTTNQLDHRRTSMEKTNGQIQARTKDLRDAVGKAKASRERKQLADAREKLNQVIEQADTLYKDSADRTDDARPRIDLGAELDHARHTAHENNNPSTLEQAAERLTDAMRRVNESMQRKTEADAAGQRPSPSTGAPDHGGAQPHAGDADAGEPGQSGNGFPPQHKPSWDTNQGDSPIFPDELRFEQR